MGKIIISDNVSLDGVIQDPAGDEGFRVGGWVGAIAGRPELAKVTLDEALGTEALLLGRGLGTMRPGISASQTCRTRAAPPFTRWAAELSRAGSRRRRCAAPRPALPAPGSALLSPPGAPSPPRLVPRTATF